MATTIESRRRIAERLHPQGIPPLWCPPITHYRVDGDVDGPRTRSHLTRVLPWAPCVLVPGSTGDGWELDDAAVRDLLLTVLPIVRDLGGKILIGALDPDPRRAAQAAVERFRLLADPAPGDDPVAACAAAGIAGIAVCPPAGAELSEAAIEAGLRETLELGLPTALYQLPQITKNELSPASFGRLAEAYPNFYLFKDTSGADRIALSGEPRQGIFFVRGAEGDFLKWLARTDAGTEGRYDGFLLSSANAFAPELAELIRLARHGAEFEAEALSTRIDGAIGAMLSAADSLPYGNAFSNANRALDHILAYGATATVPGPATRSGIALPPELLARAAEVLAAGGFSPGTGYLEPRSGKTG